jgi:hypothetical protein
MSIPLGVLIPVVLGAFAAALVYYFKFYKNKASKVGVDEKNNAVQLKKSTIYLIIKSKWCL